MRRVGSQWGEQGKLGLEEGLAPMGIKSRGNYPEKNRPLNKRSVDPRNNEGKTFEGTLDCFYSRFSTFSAVKPLNHGTSCRWRDGRLGQAS